MTDMTSSTAIYRLVKLLMGTLSLIAVIDFHCCHCHCHCLYIIPEATTTFLSILRFRLSDSVYRDISRYFALARGTDRVTELIRCLNSGGT